MNLVAIFKPNGHVLIGSVSVSRKRARKFAAQEHGQKWGLLHKQGFRVRALKGKQ